MAQKVTVILEDDLTGGPAKHTVRFAFDGTDYEIDLNAKNAAAFGKQLAPYIEHARKAGRAHPAGPGGPTVSVRVISGPGQRSTAWRSVSAGASPLVCWSSTTPRSAGADTSHHHCDPRTMRRARAQRGNDRSPSGPRFKLGAGTLLDRARQTKNSARSAA